MRFFFHWGAATLSTVFVDLETRSGVLFFTSVGLTTNQPRQTLTCMIDRLHNGNLFGVIYDSLPLLR